MVIFFLNFNVIGDPFNKLKRLFNEIDDDGSHRLRLERSIHLLFYLKKKLFLYK